MIGAVVGAIFIINPNLAPVTTDGFGAKQPLVSVSVIQEVSDSEKVEQARISRILADLRQCESGGNDEAINPEDLDGTPSFSRYQFKPSTLYEWGMRYKILPIDLEKAEIMNIIMDGELQEKVLVEAIREYGKSSKFWLSQFPGCSKIYKFWQYK